MKLACKIQKFWFANLAGNWKIWSTTGIEENEDPRYALPKCLELVLCGPKADSQPILLQPQSEYAFQIGEIDQFKVCTQANNFIRTLCFNLQ